MLKEYLESEEFEVLTACDGLTGIQAATSQLVDIIVLDVMIKTSR